MTVALENPHEVGSLYLLMILCDVKLKCLNRPLLYVQFHVLEENLVAMYDLHMLPVGLFTIEEDHWVALCTARLQPRLFWIVLHHAVQEDGAEPLLILIN